MTREEAINNLKMISVAFVEAETKEQRKIIDDTFNIAINALEQLTSYEQTINKLTKAISEQEPKTGHWSHDGSHWKNRFICSECGYKLFDEPTNYCPNCGAKMESEDKE